MAGAVGLRDLVRHVTTVAASTAPQPTGTESFIHMQLRVLRALMGYKFGDDAFDTWMGDQLAHALTTYYGIRDIRNLGIEYREWDCINSDSNNPWSQRKITEYRYVDKTTNRDITEWRFAHGRHFDPETGEWGAFSQYTMYCEGHYGGDVSAGTGEFPIWGEPEAFALLGEYGEDNVYVYVRFMPNGIPLFYPRRIKRKGLSFGQAFAQLAMIALAAVSVVVPGAIAAISPMIFGSYAAAYPAITTALTNVMMNTALNGGDIEAAVTAAATSSLGSAIGGVVSGVSDSQAIGRLTAVAATTAISGGDVESAVARAALQMAPGVVADAFAPDFVGNVPAVAPTLDPSAYDAPSTEGSEMYDFENFDFGQGYGADVAAAVMPPPTEFDFENFDFGQSYTGDVGDAIAQNAGFDFENFDFNSGDVFATGTPDSSTGLVGPVIDSGSVSYYTDTASGFDPTGYTGDVTGVANPLFEGTTFQSVVENITSVAIAALQIQRAYNAAGQPAVRAPVTVTAAGTQTIRADGTLVTTRPGLPAVVTRPPAGVPYVLPSGAGIVTNNGDGTYTIIDAAGAARILPYSAASAVTSLATSELIPGVPNTILAGGVGLLAVLLLSRRGRR